MPPPPRNSAGQPGKITAFVHQAHSSGGRITAALTRRGYDVRFCRCPLGEPVPDDLAGCAGVVIFGGPMSANDHRLPFIRQELAVIETCLKGNIPFLGVCLGGQLLAMAAGGRVARAAGEWYEVGYYPVSPTESGRAFFPGGDTLTFQWHGEGIFLDSGTCRIQAGNDRFPVQMFSLPGNVHGIQFHPEVTEPTRHLMLARSGHYLLNRGTQSRAVQRALAPAGQAQMTLWTENFLDQWPGGQEQPAPETRNPPPARAAGDTQGGTAPVDHSP